MTKRMHLILLTLFFGLQGHSALAETNTTTTQPKVQTVTEIKEKCKSDGKQGKDLLQCIKDQQTK